MIWCLKSQIRVQKDYVQVKMDFKSYNVFHQFMQAKFVYEGSILSSSDFKLLPQPPLKMTLVITVVKIDLKIIIFLPHYKSVKQTKVHKVQLVNQ